MPPGILFVGGSLFVAESPRWLFRRGRKEQALDCAAAIAKPASRPPRTRGDGADFSRQPNAPARGHEGFAAAAEVCSAVPAGMRHSLLQYGNGHQLHHWIQHRHTAAKRPVGSARALGICAVHVCELPDDPGRNDAGGPQRAKVPASFWELRASSCACSLSARSFCAQRKNRYDVRDAIQSQVAPDQNLLLQFDQPRPSAFCRQILSAPTGCP